MFLALPVSAQLNNFPLYRTNPVKPEYAKDLRVGIRSLGFSKNNEYSNNIADGYTLFGYQLNPTLSYQPSANFKIEGGVFLHKDFGNSKYREIQPTFSFTYAKNRHKLIFGTLEGPLNHGYIEPLWDFENALTNPLQNGFQYQYSGNRVNLNTWVDWQNMIYDFDPEQEVIAAGFTGRVNLWHKFSATSDSEKINEMYERFKQSQSSPTIPEQDTSMQLRIRGTSPHTGTAYYVDLNAPVTSFRKYYLSFPIQATVKHWGGQIDLNPNPVVTLVNGAVGFELTRNFEAIIRKNNQGRFGSDFRFQGAKIYQLYIKNYLVGYTGDAPLTQKPFDSGYGIYLNAGAETKYGEVMLSYWQGDGYISEFGGRLYQSVSTTVKKPDYTEKKRKVLILRLMKDFQLAEGVTLTARAEPHYDFKSAPLEFSTGFYLAFNSDFFITSLKKDKGAK